MFLNPDDEKSSETLFAGYVPVSMVKEILEVKSLLALTYADLCSNYGLRFNYDQLALKY